MRRYHIKQKVFKILDRYDIYDPLGNVCFRVEQKWRMLRYEASVTESSGRPSFSIRQKLAVLLPEYHVQLYNGETALIKSRFTLLYRKIDLTSSRGNLQVTGSFWDYNFEVFRHGEKVAHIEKAFLTWADTYEITIYDETFTEIILALMIAIDNIKDNSRNA